MCCTEEEQLFLLGWLGKLEHFYYELELLESKTVGHSTIKKLYFKRKKNFKKIVVSCTVSWKSNFKIFKTKNNCFEKAVFELKVVHRPDTSV